MNRLPLNLDLVHGHVELGRARQNGFDTLDDVVRHERLPIVFSDVTLGGEAGLRSQVARELPAVVVLDDDDLGARRQDRQDGVCMERDQPFDLRSEEHTSELQSQSNLVCRLLLEKKKKYTY